MKTLSSIKKDMEFNRGLSSLIDVLKTIAVSQYRTLEQKIKSFEKLLITIESFFESIDTTAVSHPFLNPESKAQAVVAVTSDSGLLGGLNMQVVNQALIELEKVPGRLIVIGERGKMYLRDINTNFTAFSGIKDEERYTQAAQLRDFLIKRFLEGSFGRLKVVYPKPVSFTVQIVETMDLLPFRFSHRNSAVGAELLKSADTIFESRLEDIIEYLVYVWVGQKLYEIFGLSRLAEFAARFVHLEGSHQRLKDMDAKVRLEYFRVRHELIDRNMRELFAARLLYAA
jgi:F-type H+-transporting ATPase subunit gamma